jgi:hypothetical protein
VLIQPGSMAELFEPVVANCTLNFVFTAVFAIDFVLD